VEGSLCNLQPDDFSNKEQAFSTVRNSAKNTRPRLLFTTVMVMLSSYRL
jgi:hypothetical protein